MKKQEMTLPELALIAGTRGVLGSGNRIVDIRQVE